MTGLPIKKFCQSTMYAVLKNRLVDWNKKRKNRRRAGVKPSCQRTLVTEKAKTLLPVLSSTEILSDTCRQAGLECLYQWSGVSAGGFTRYYLETIKRFARLVQLLPCVSHKQTMTVGWDTPGEGRPGLTASVAQPPCLLDSLFSDLLNILKRRQNVVVNKTECEQPDFIETLWTYAAFSAGLANALGQLVTDYEVLLYADADRCLGRWNVLTSNMPDKHWYEYRICKTERRQVRFVNHLNLLLASRILPNKGLLILRQDAALFEMWCRVVAGDTRCLLGNIVHGITDSANEQGRQPTPESGCGSPIESVSASESEELTGAGAKSGVRDAQPDLTNSQQHDALDAGLRQRYKQ